MSRATEFLGNLNESLGTMADALVDIKDALCDNPQSIFVNRVAHALTSSLNDHYKLNVIRILYKQMAWPEVELQQHEKELLMEVYK